MKLLRFRKDGKLGLAVARKGESFTGIIEGDPAWPGDLTPELLAKMPLAQLGELLSRGERVNENGVERLPPLAKLRKIICVGLNYVDHAAEAGREVPTYPTLFARFETSLLGDGASLMRPRVSDMFDFEGELVALIGTGGRHIAKANALKHVAAYSLFNDGSVRDFQRKTVQWTVGKNFDGTGPFGPWWVTTDDLPEGCRGLRLQTRLNGEVVQSAMIDDMIFDVATLVSTISESMTLEPGDVIVTGTPSGVGAARKPPLWMKPGDVCEVEVDGIGVLRNPVALEAA